MTQRLSVGLLTLAWVELIAGVLGCGVLICWLLIFMGWQPSFFNPETIRMFLMYFCVVGLVPVLMLISGIGILRGKLWAWRLNVFFLPAFYCLCLFLLIGLEQNSNSLIKNILLLSFWIFPPIPIVFFLIQKRFRIQFKKGEI